MVERFRRIVTGHDEAWRGKAAAASDSIGARQAADHGSDDPMMHRTSTVDCPIVLKGKIWPVLGDSEVCLKQGDVTVQRGTNPFVERPQRAALPAAAILVGARPVEFPAVTHNSERGAS